MNSQPAETREPLGAEITAEHIRQLIDERKGVGATSCDVVTEDDQRFLVCQWPPL